jgi:hypothetical protein
MFCQQLSKIRPSISIVGRSAVHLNVNRILQRTATTAAKTTTTKHDEGIPPNLKSEPVIGKAPWKSTSAVPLTRENYLDLLYGRTPTLWQPGFVSPALSWEYEKRLSPQLTPYKHNTGPLLTKVGVAQFEYQAQAAQDFTKRTDGKEELPLSHVLGRLY